MRDGAAGDDHMVGTFERYTQRGTHSTSGNDADREPRGTQPVDMLHRRRPRKFVFSFVPVLRCGYRTATTRLTHSSRRRRRPPPVGVACNLASSSATDCPPVSSALRCRGCTGAGGGGVGCGCGGGCADSVASVGGVSGRPGSVTSGGAEWRPRTNGGG